MRKYTKRILPISIKTRFTITLLNRKVLKLINPFEIKYCSFKSY